MRSLCHRNWKKLFLAIVCVLAIAFISSPSNASHSSILNTAVRGGPRYCLVHAFNCELNAHNVSHVDLFNLTLYSTIRYGFNLSSNLDLVLLIGEECFGEVRNVIKSHAGRTGLSIRYHLLSQQQYTDFNLTALAREESQHRRETLPSYAAKAAIGKWPDLVNYHACLFTDVDVIMKYPIGMQWNLDFFMRKR
jgi:hypothetical protein